MKTRRKIVPAILLLGIGASAFAAFAHATAPGKNGKLAFSRYRYREDVPPWSEIFVVNSDGSSARKITHAPKGYEDDHPDWAPNGSKLVFQRCAPNKGRCLIWSVNPDGTGQKRLSPLCSRAGSRSKCVDDTGPAYAPDGRHIAFFRFGGPSSFGLMIGDTHLRHVRRVAIGTNPAWSPDGERLAFARFNDPGTGLQPVNGRAIFTVNADGTHLHRLTAWGLKAGDRPDWSPDGTRILFRTMPNGEDDYGKGNIYTIRPDGSGLRQLTHFPPTTRVLQTGSYSADGTSILFATTAGATRGLGLLPDVFVMGADGTDIRPVTRSRNWDSSPDWGPRR